MPIRIFRMRVTVETLPEFAKVLQEVKPGALIARRVLPELWGEDRAGGLAFADVLAEEGVSEILIEGRVASERSTNALKGIDEEVELLSTRFREVTRAKALSYLVLR